MPAFGDIRPASRWRSQQTAKLCLPVLGLCCSQSRNQKYEALGGTPAFSGLHGGDWAQILFGLGEQSLPVSGQLDFDISQ
jgi:hypothetical protein